MDYADANLTVIPSKIGDCCKLCANHSGCAAGVYNKPSQSCILKAGVDRPLSVDYGSMAYILGPAPSPSPGDWPSQIKGLYNVVEDPRELHDLQHELSDKVLELHERLIYWNATTVPSIHPKPKKDEKGKAHRLATDCISPWQDWDPSAVGEFHDVERSVV